MYRPPDHILIIFGASGDLTRRKLIPALRELQKLDLLPEKFAVLGIGRTTYSDESFREMISEHLEDPGEIVPLLHYISMDPEKEDAYEGLGAKLASMVSKRQMPANYIFYLATPPKLYGSVPVHLSNAGLTSESEGEW